MNRLFAFVMLLVALSYSVSAQTEEPRLKDRRITIHMTAQPLGNVFRYLIGTCDIPIGFEQSTLDFNHRDYDFESNPGMGKREMESTDGKIKATLSGQRKFVATEHLITIDGDNKPLPEVFDAIVAQMENYKWEITDEVVDIFPSKGRDERFEKILSLRVAKFSVKTGDSVRAITTNIIALPEFQSVLKETDLHFNGFRGGADFIIAAQYGRQLPSGVEFSDITLRDLLNRATTIKRGGWILRVKYTNKTGADGKIHIDIDI